MNATKSKAGSLRERAQRRIHKRTGARGDLSAVAAILGVSPSTVMRWRRGVLPQVPYARLILDRIAS